MSEITVNALKGSYKVIIKSGLRRDFIENLQKQRDEKRHVIISDENVASIYRASLDELFQTENIETEWIIVEPGEKTKSLETVDSIIKKLIEIGVKRDETIIAFGGGVVGDLAGFVASIYLRGISWVYIPTTLLSMADASIGGKVGIHFQGYKNMIGAFHQPSLVLIDPDFLLTLMTRDFLSGLSEIIKMAILPGGENFAIWDETCRESIFTRNPEFLSRIISDACSMKAFIVEHDEFDKAGRIMLNLGHTIGHALESATDFKRFTHGEAVCVGTLFMCEFSNSKGDMSDDDLSKIQKVYSPITSELPNLASDWKTLKQAIDKDKKWKSEELNWVYPMAIGKACVRNIPDDELEKFWTTFKDDFGRRYGNAG